MNNPEQYIERAEDALREATRALQEAQPARQTHYLTVAAVNANLARAAIELRREVEYGQSLAQAAQQLAADYLPHSRACGIRKHPHGSECHKNCPTCGGHGRA